MAKQKKEKLYCDLMVAQNNRWIQTLGKVVNAKELYNVVANDFVYQAIAKGVPTDQIESVVKAQLDKTEIMCQMVGFTAVNNWYWGGRQVYRFDKDLAELLYSQTKDDVEVDCKTLSLLPCPNFYISLNDKTRYGFFVSYSDNVLYISDMINDRTESYAFQIPKSEEKLTSIISNSNTKYAGKEVTHEQTLELSKRIAMFMQFIVYLSAINAEIEPVTKGSIITRQAGQKPVTRHDKTEISNVGYRLGEALRANKTEKTNIKYVGEHAQGSPKSPHIRRSHFHSYWTGSGENKELVVKWVNTIFVHGDSDAKDISTVHKVE